MENREIRRTGAQLPLSPLQECSRHCCDCVPKRMGVTESELPQNAGDAVLLHPYQTFPDVRLWSRSDNGIHTDTSQGCHSTELTVMDFQLRCNLRTAHLIDEWKLAWDARVWSVNKVRLFLTWP